jgi:transposase
MLHVGLDLCRTRVDVCALDDHGERVLVTKAPVDEEGLRGFGQRVLGLSGGEPPRAAVESMTGSRHVRDVLAGIGWQVSVADAVKVKGIAPLACKTDKIDAWVLAELCRRDLVPAIWLPPLGIRADRERVRFRYHLVKHRTMLKARVHSGLIAFGKPAAFTDMFGVQGRAVLAGLDLPVAWTQSLDVTLEVIDFLDRQIRTIDKRLHEAAKTDKVVQRLQTAPGIGPVFGATIAAEIGDITRFGSAAKLAGYSGLCPRVYQSGNTDRRGHLTKAGPALLRWALIEAAVHACRHPAYATRYDATIARLGKTRGRKIARVQLARDLAHGIWHMLTKEQDFAPAGAPNDLVA